MQLEFDFAADLTDFEKSHDSEMFKMYVNFMFGSWHRELR